MLANGLLVAVYDEECYLTGIMGGLKQKSLKYRTVSVILTSRVRLWFVAAQRACKTLLKHQVRQILHLEEHEHVRRDSVKALYKRRSICKYNRFVE